MMWMIALTVFALGAIVGSFLNVAALRWIAEQPYTGRSYCPFCRQTLLWWQLIPIVSFMYLRGRCHTCHHPISVQYPIVELIGGAVALIIFLPPPSTSHEALVAALTTMLIYLLLVLAVIDFHTMLLPDIHILGVATLVGMLLAIDGEQFMSALLGAVWGSGLLLLLWLITRGRGIGFGDIKLMIPLGALLGISGTLFTLWAAFIIGGIVGIFLLWQRIATLKTAVPFGPMLIAAAIVIVMAPHLPAILLHWLGVLH